MGKFIDISGRRFGRWTARKYLGGSKWHCECTCGTTKSVHAFHLKSGASASCGCVNIERKTTHGMSATRAYNIWRSMLNRCRSTRPRYGGRGIAVCDRWQSFENFITDMGQPPSKRHEIDRIDNDGNYEPGNCRWATRLQQNQNRSDSVRLKFRGQNKHVDEWAKIVGMSPGAIKRRIKGGMSAHEALTKPSRVTTYYKQHACAHCGASFMDRRRLEKNKHAYCSRECYRAHRFGAVLTPERIAALRQRRAEGASLGQLVKEFGIHKSSVWRAVKP